MKYEMNSLLAAFVLGLSLLFITWGSWTGIAIANHLTSHLAQAPDAIQGDWQLVGWGDPENLTPLVADTEITANFTGDRLSGSGGCNRYTTSYSVTGSTVTVGAVAATRRACLPAIDDQEINYFRALDGVQTYRLTPDGQLELTYQTETGSGILVFRRLTIRGLW